MNTEESGGDETGLLYDTISDFTYEHRNKTSTRKVVSVRGSNQVPCTCVSYLCAALKLEYFVKLFRSSVEATPYTANGHCKYSPANIGLSCPGVCN
jgi:hypothetical protein